MSKWFSGIKMVRELASTAGISRSLVAALLSALVDIACR